MSTVYLCATARYLGDKQGRSYMQITRGALVTPDKENPVSLSRALKRVKQSLRRSTPVNHILSVTFRIFVRRRKNVKWSEDLWNVITKPERI